MASAEKPTTISGGCLCEAIRYTITFPPDHDFLNSVGGGFLAVTLFSITF